MFVLTTRFEVELLAPVTEGVLEALGEVVEENRRIEATATLKVMDETVARGRGEFARGTNPGWRRRLISTRLKPVDGCRRGPRTK